MSGHAPPSRLDRFVSSRSARRVAFAWGLAEATFFFIVPDLFLTLLGARALRPAVGASVAALGGAILGGCLMYLFGRGLPSEARALLDHVPAISPSLLLSVDDHLREHGLIAVMLGPLKGIPYKIYAVAWGASGLSLAQFVLISIPARYARFLLSTVAARAIASLLKPWTRNDERAEVIILVIVWALFYGFYFWRMGW